jgi:hypothetical protein
MYTGIRVIRYQVSAINGAADGENGGLTDPGGKVPGRHMVKNGKSADGCCRFEIIKLVGGGSGATFNCRLTIDEYINARDARDAMDLGTANEH